MSLTEALRITEASDECRFMAAMLASAAQDAMKGNVEAAAWILRASPFYIDWVVSDTMDPEAVHAALLARIPAATRQEAALHIPEAPQPSRIYSKRVPDTAPAPVTAEAEGICRMTWHQAALEMEATP